MSSLVNDPGGRRRIVYTDPATGARRALRLGQMDKATAGAVQLRVDRLIAVKMAGGSIPYELAKWLQDVPDALHEKLATAGLVPVRESATVQAFVDEYVAAREADTKPGTRLVYGHTRRCMVAHFGTRTQLRDVTQGDADEFRRFLIRQGLSENTVRRRLGIARQFFNAAKRKRLIDENPFAGMKTSMKSNFSRFHFVSHEDAQKVIERCPDAEMRLIFALSRYGGLRCPSEHLALRWSDVDWEFSRMTVTSPKTAHHEGGESRVIPIFPELLPHLQAVYDELPEGAGDWVIQNYRDPKKNFRTRFTKIIKRAGVELWPKLFQNLRSTRETELADKFPIHVVCRWMGNSQPVAAKHYLQLTDEHFALATGTAARNTARGGAESAGNEGKQKTENRENPTVSASCQPAPSDQWALQDSKPGPINSDSTTNYEKQGRGSGAQSGAPLAEPSIQRVISVWPRLSSEQRQAIARICGEAAE